jgi:hypothetical protein
MDFNNISIEKLVQYINLELSKDKNISVNKLCDRIGIKKSTLKSRMTRADYSYNIDLRQYAKDNTTNNTIEVQQEVAVAKDDNTSNTTELNNIDVDKLNLLLNNLDSLLDLVNKKHNTSSITIDSKETRVTSLRINQQLYDMIKDRAVKENTSISDIVNRSLIDYLNNYI